MAKARSPSYPSVGLATAIEKVTSVYEKDAQNSIPREVVAKHAGFSGITGGSLSMLSSLLKYGLLTGRGDNTAVSDLALQIIAHPKESDERRQAILQAAFSPTLFSEIRDHFKSGKVSDPALRAYLLTRKFLPSAVEPVIRAYRETMALVESESNGYTSGSPEGASPQDMDSSPMQPQTQVSPASRGRPEAPGSRPQSTEPYQISLVPGHLMGKFDISDEATADELINAIKAFKILFRTFPQSRSAQSGQKLLDDASGGLEDAEQWADASKPKDET